MSWTTQVFTTVLIAILLASPTRSDWKENAEAIDISGGENHTLVLTANKCPWACGPNGGAGPYYGVLGTGSTSNTLVEKSLVQVHDGDMNTPSPYLEDINDLDAGWKHSLALESYDPCDPNYMGYVWAGEQDYNEPNHVYLKDIVAVSAGWDHSMAPEKA